MNDDNKKKEELQIATPLSHLYQKPETKSQYFAMD